MKPAVVIIGANDFQLRAILRAKEMGYETHVFAWRDGAVGEAAADRFYPISITEKEQILAVCRGIRPAGVVSVASDLAVPTVSFLAEQLGLAGNSPLCARVSTNKYEMRRRFREAGVSTPGFALVASPQECETLDLAFPLIVKPVDRSGSRGVTRVEDEARLKEAAASCIDCSFERRAIVEEFIEGEEFSAEGISWQGRHRILAFTKKFTTGAPHFIETGHLQPAPLGESVQAAALAEILRALDALGIQNGASHSEFRVGPDGRVRLIEIGARMGGDCIGSDLVPLSTGFDYLRMVIDAACGKEPDFTPVSAPKCAYVQFVFTRRDRDRLQALTRRHPESAVRVCFDGEPGTRAVTDSSARFGYAILASSVPQPEFEPPDGDR